MTVQPALSPAETLRLGAQLRRLFSASPGFQWTVDSGDEMLRYSVASVRGSLACGALLYFLRGFQIAAAAEQIARWRFGEPAGTGAVLDFAAGWGRSTRFLAEIFPPARVFAADTVAEALAAQSALFGVQTLATTASPDSLRPSQRFDLILAASFFSHLPEATFSAWLRRLAAALTADGVLIFSTHGLELLGGPAPVDGSGFVFLAASESSRLDPDDYGTCYVDETYVRAAVRRELGEEFAVSSWRRGLAGHQDLYLLRRGAQPPPALDRYPWGDVDRFDRGATLELAGWCADLTEGGAVDSIELTVEAAVVASCVPAASHQRSAGEWRGHWALSVPRAELGLDDVLALWAKNSRGRQNLIGLGTLRQFPDDR